MRRARSSGTPRDAGTGALEFLGVVTLAGILVLAGVGAAATQSPAMSDKIHEVICAITGGSCPASSVPSNVAYEPEACDVYTRGDTVSSVVDIAFIRLGSGAVVERVEKSDGTIEISLLGDGRAGAVASAGGRAELNLGERSFAAKLEAEAALTAGLLGGDVWTFRDRDEADDFQRYLQRELGEDVVGAAVPPVRALNGIYEWATRESAPSNDGIQRTIVRGDVKAEGEASASAGYGTGAGASASAVVALGVEFDRGQDAADPSDDERTDFFSIDWKAAGQAGLPVVAGIEGSTAASGVIKVTRNADDEVTRVTVVDRSTGSFSAGLVATDGSVTPIGPEDASTTLQGAGLDFVGGEDNSVVVTRTLDLDSASDRSAFDAWMAQGAGSATAIAQTVPGVDSAGNEGIVGGFGDAADFADMLRSQGRTSVVEYDGTTWGLGGALELGLGLKLGLDAGYSNSESSAVSAYYLGAPDADGTRPPIPLPACVR